MIFYHVQELREVDMPQDIIQLIFLYEEEVNIYQEKETPTEPHILQLPNLFNDGFLPFKDDVTVDPGEEMKPIR